MTTHRNRLGRVVRTIAALTLALGLSLAGFAAWTAADAQNTRRRSTQAPAREQPLAPPVIRTFESNETVQADISTRTIPVTSNFSGTEIVIFGAVDNSRQKSAESGLYDIVITVEGAPSAITSRRKVRFFGIWLNSEEVTFDDAPSFYAQVSTRPADDFASNELQREYDIGFSNLRMTPRPVPGNWLTAAETNAFRDSIVRLKSRSGLYLHDPYGAMFVGRSLFRASLVLPANVQVGPFETRVHLFRDGKLLSQYSVRLDLQREGLERYLHTLAYSQPFVYGIATVLLAVSLGLGASALFRKNAA